MYMRTICIGYLVLLTGWTVSFDIQLNGYTIRNVVSSYSELSIDWTDIYKYKMAMVFCVHYVRVRSCQTVLQ